MTCDELKAHLIDYLEGAGDREALEAHIAACPSCRAEAASLGAVWEGLGAWRDEEPDPLLKVRVLDALDRASHVPSVNPSLWRTAKPYVGASLAVALLAIGAWIGSRYSAPPAAAPDPRPEYVLFLYDDPVTESARTADEMQRTVEEYRIWARGLAGEGKLVAGEKLKGERRLFGALAGGKPIVPGGVELGGYFVIRAGSMEEAEAIAATCPHLVHGGAIELRPIDPV